MTDVIICLGYRGLGNIQKERVKKAVELYKKKKRKIIFTGKNAQAKFMGNLAVKLGINKKDIILEDKALTTIGNAHYSQKIMDDLGFKSATIVTSKNHMPRASLTFKIRMFDKKLSFVNA